MDMMPPTRLGTPPLPLFQVIGRCIILRDITSPLRLALEQIPSSEQVLSTVAHQASVIPLTFLTDI
jgi:hypothetical protein